MAEDDGIALISSGRRTTGEGDKDTFDSDAWARLAHAGDSHAFASSWLDIQCRAFEGVIRGAVILRASEAAAFAPFAVWPEGIEGSPRLAAVVERALQRSEGLMSEHGALVVETGKHTGFARCDHRVHLRAHRDRRVRRQVARPAEVFGQRQAGKLGQLENDEPGILGLPQGGLHIRGPDLGVPDKEHDLDVIPGEQPADGAQGAGQGQGVAVASQEGHSETGGGLRLKETVTAGSCPRWFTERGPTF